jgi:hypothetical protein
VLKLYIIEPVGPWGEVSLNTHAEINSKDPDACLEFQNIESLDAVITWLMRARERILNNKYAGDDRPVVLPQST